MTEAEERLWHHIRKRQIGGCKFRRQQPIGPYIADFICFEKRLIIELDGGQHAETLIMTQNAMLGFVRKDTMFSDSGIIKYFKKRKPLKRSS